VSLLAALYAFFQGGVPVWRQVWALGHARGSRAGSAPLRAAEL